MVLVVTTAKTQAKLNIGQIEMMKKQIQNNYVMEWARDPHSSQIKEAIILANKNSMIGIKSIETFANKGSALASFLMGDVYLYGRYGAIVDEAVAERWLKRSADLGSIEGRYRLAKYFERKGLHDLAVENYRVLAEREKFSPAMFILGYKFEEGHGIPKSRERALEYFIKADRQGHLHAGHWLSHIYLRKADFKSVFKGLVKRVKILIPFVYLKLRDPASDRLRS